MNIRRFERLYKDGAKINKGRDNNYPEDALQH